MTGSGKTVVIETGSARCPRCMAVAEYRFHEDARGALRYEVSCRPCGNLYSEDCSSPQDASAA